MQRSVRENIALPFSARLGSWGLDRPRSARAAMVDGAVETLQIDARAGGEVRRLSGGNQQKVTIARWVAGGVRTMLCFDPTRGIDIRTKNQIYVLLRDLAEAGAAVLLYTSELKEIQLVCDRAIVIFGGRVVAEIAAADADEPALLRAAYNLTRRRGAARGARPRSRAVEAQAGAPADGRRRRRPGRDAEASATRRRPSRPRPRRRVARRGRRRSCAIRRNAWIAGPARVPRRPARCSPRSSSRDYGPVGAPGPRRPRCCRWRWRPSPRRSSSSAAASTSRSASMMALTSVCRGDA